MPPSSSPRSWWRRAGFLATLLAVALTALLVDVPLVTLCTALGVLAWVLGACESRNLWDCLIDPLLFVWAASALLLRGAKASVRMRARVRGRRRWPT